MLFEAATATLIDDVAGSEGKGFGQCLVRALLFRAWLTTCAREEATTQAHVFGPAIDSALRNLSLA